ncbi:MAG: YihY/virulence factor BrkB family protein [Rickettsiales bacterium]|nr:YihY/virulence factor BrkB family protein [Rickettsiales bacterium]
MNTINHDGIEHAGYLAFLGLLAMFPFLVFIVAVIGFLGQGEAGAQLVKTLLEALPGNLTVALRPRIEEIVSGPPQGLLTVSILGAIWTASSAVEGIRTILNRAYHVAAPPAYWFRRSLSVLQLLVFTFIMISGMILVVMLQLIFQPFSSWLDAHLSLEMQEYMRKLLYMIAVSALFLAISSIYYLIPNIKQRFMAVAPGAVLVLLGWWAAAAAFAYYLSNFNQVNLIYGSLGGIIAALVFLYVCNVIFIFGAEFNYLLSQAMGVRIQKDATARETEPPEQVRLGIGD